METASLLGQGLVQMVKFGPFLNARYERLLRCRWPARPRVELRPTAQQLAGLPSLLPTLFLKGS